MVRTQKIETRRRLFAWNSLSSRRIEEESRRAADAPQRGLNGHGQLKLLLLLELGRIECEGLSLP